MSEQVKKIKIIDAISESLIADIETCVKQIKGVLDAKIDLETYVLNYVIDAWASDYDVMVSIMNVLSDEFKIESEPFFDDSEEDLKPVEEYVYEPEVESEEDGESEEITETQSKKKEVKLKFIEVGISLICLIVGLILSSIPKTESASPYLYTIAFSLVGYEFIFNTLASIFKKQFDFSAIALLLALLSCLVLGTPLGGAIVMIFYNVTTILLELYKLDFEEKYGYNFNLNATAKLNKVNGVILGSVFVICLLIAFVLPAFLGEYSDNLYDCAKKANAVLLIFSITPSLCYLPLSYALTYKHALKNGVTLNGEEVYKNVAKVKKVAFLGQNVFTNDSGSVNEDALGCVLELYDAGVLETVLLSSKPKESTSKLRKELSITKSVSNLDDNGKISEVEALKNADKKQGVLAVGNLKTNADATLCLSLDENGEFNVSISNGDLKKVPYTVKLLKRFKSIILQNAIVTLIVKIAFSALCAFGVITSLSLLVAPILIVSVLSILNVLRNSMEII